MLISVIVPVYNVEAYLKKCVESIQKQTYRELEIILVDDGSPDNSGRICDELEKSDTRIKVIHQQNMGLSGARNTALDMMQGDAVTFVDSDDTIDAHMIEYLVNDMEQYDADIVECQLCLVSGGRITANSHFKETKVCNTEQALLIDLSSKGGSISACGKLYRKKIFHSHRFEVGKICEDWFAIIESLRQAERIVIDNRPLYYYYHRNNSITTTPFSTKMFDQFEGAKRIVDTVKNEFPGALPGALFRYDWSRLWVLDRILLDKEWRQNKYLKDVLRQIRKDILKILKSPYFTKNKKLGAALASISPMLYRQILLYIWKRK